MFLFLYTASKAVIAITCSRLLKQPMDATILNAPGRAPNRSTTEIPLLLFQCQAPLLAIPMLSVSCRTYMSYCLKVSLFFLKLFVVQAMNLFQNREGSKALFNVFGKVALSTIFHCFIIPFVQVQEAKKGIHLWVVSPLHNLDRLDSHCLYNIYNLLGKFVKFVCQPYLFSIS